MCEGDYIWNPATCSGKNSKYLPSIVDDSVIICDEIIEETKTVPANLLEKKKKTTCKTKHICFLLSFLNYYRIIYSC